MNAWSKVVPEAEYRVCIDQEAESSSKIRHAVEIGAGDRYSSQLLGRASEFERVQLVEPNQILFEDLADAARGLPNVTVHGCAIGHVVGQASLVHMGYASYLVGADSFLRLSVETEEHWKPLTATAPMVTIGQLEAQPIDYLVVTNNGGEMFVLNAMTSRPATIVTKHYIHQGAQAAAMQKVVDWMAGNGYRGRVVETNQHQTLRHISWERAHDVRE